MCWPKGSKLKHLIQQLVWASNHRVLSVHSNWWGLYTLTPFSASVRRRPIFSSLPLFVLLHRDSPGAVCSSLSSDKKETLIEDSGNVEIGNRDYKCQYFKWADEASDEEDEAEEVKKPIPNLPKSQVDVNSPMPMFPPKLMAQGENKLVYVLLRLKLATHQSPSSKRIPSFNSKQEI
ncbi:hypothetical protein RIF29_25833 [Crotalaria pallida]|uniref:Uncharacterized protein n=1 Tax=Crotalaria pallida TaxID=3830 RepID=A0AAN9EMY5_CROPI